MFLGVIADDFTGATDIASFLVAAGVDTIQTVGIPSDDLDVTAEAVVISLKSRSSPPAEAVGESLAALAWLKARGCPQIYQKYCSTFDSTAQGNIGPVADALLDALGDDFTVICPALPINGRTIYNGHLFVGGALLSESGMRHHPITPMTDSSLVRLMEAQSRGTCGVVPLETVMRGANAVEEALAAARRKGHRYAVLDAVTDEHLLTLGRAVRKLALLSGGSGLAAGLAATWRDRLSDPARAADAGRPQGKGRMVVLAGSCSQMTNAQVAAYREKAPSRAIEIDRCRNDAAYAGELADWVVGMSGGRWAPMVHATTDPQTLARVQADHGLEISTAIERIFADLATRLSRSGFDRFVVAGGETSGAVTWALGVTAFHIGPTIAPGVPWVRAVDRPCFMALKSGNFGKERFFFDCQDTGS